MFWAFAVSSDLYSLHKHHLLLCYRMLSDLYKSQLVTLIIFLSEQSGTKLSLNYSKLYTLIDTSYKLCALRV